MNIPKIIFIVPYRDRAENKEQNLSLSISPLSITSRQILSDTSQNM